MAELTIAATEVARSEIRVFCSDRVGPSQMLDQFVYRAPARFSAPEIRFSEPQPLYVAGNKFTIAAERTGIVPGSTYLFGEYSWRSLFDPARPILPTPDEPVLVAGNAPWRNYSHWLFQCLPPILLAPRVGLQAPHALVPPLNDVKRDLLALAGVGPDRFTELPESGAAFLQQGIYTNLSAGDFPFTPHPAIVEPFELLAQRAQRSLYAGQRVFLSRADSRKRVMINEAELSARLQAEGYAVVMPGTLSAIEQIALFRDAALLVGAHGAGFTNLLFAPRGEAGPIVVELHQENYPASAFAKLCQVKRLRYTAIFNRMVDPGPDGRHDSSWEADIPLILRTLGSL